MRSIPRPANSLPPDLTEKEAKELEKAAEYFALAPQDREGVKKVQFKAYKLASVKAQLEKLFGGKCAYCESFYSSTAPVDIEHYRPKGKVHGADSHDGYWWLAAQWENLLPSCIDCNRKRGQKTPRPDAQLSRLLADAASNTSLMSSGKKDSFPLADESQRAMGKDDPVAMEQPLLLNPCTDRPEDFLDFSYDRDIGASIVFPKSQNGVAALSPAGRGTDLEAVRSHAEDNHLNLMGAMSIHVYGLNRLGLVQARTQIVRQLEFLRSLVLDLDDLVAAISASNMSSAQKETVEQKVDAMQDRLLQEMRDMTDPSAPYSAVASAWVDKFLGEQRS